MKKATNKRKNNNENIQVFVRCRPLLESEMNHPLPVEMHPEVNKIFVRDTATEKSAMKIFSFDKVFGPETKQADIYNEVAAPLIKEVIMGFNCTIFAYGQTGTGKTFTIEGDRSSKLEDGSDGPLSGIIPRAMRHLFEDLTEQNSEFEILCSYIELYNEDIFDLLSKSNDLVKLKMYDNTSQKGSVIIQGLQVVPVISMVDVYAILNKGCKKRRKAETLLNKMSSRSHTIFTVIVNSKDKYSTLEKRKTGKLNLVDLAGSENIGRSGAIDERAREAGNINQSLLALGRVITSLCEETSHIPYRESKLTRLLRDSLGGQTKTTVIATISPSSADTEETLNTLDYALRAKNITNKPEVNSSLNVCSLTKDYLKEVCHLKEAIKALQSQTGFYVSEENLRNLESGIASVLNKKKSTMHQLEELAKEMESLDSKINEARNFLSDKTNKLEETKKRREGMTAELQKATQESKSLNAALTLLRPVSSKLHKKLHTKLEEKAAIEFELRQVTEKAREAVNEYKSLHEKQQKLCYYQSCCNECLQQFKDEFCENVRKVDDSVNSVTAQCNGLLSVIRNGFESAASTQEKIFSELNMLTSEMEKTSASFRENFVSMLDEQEASKLKWICDFREAHSNENSTCALESVVLLLNDCESHLNSIYVSFKDWRNDLVSKIEHPENLLNLRLKDQEKTFQSATATTETLFSKQRKYLEEYSDIISEVVNHQVKNKKKWDSCINSMELAVDSMDTMCTEYITAEIDANNQAQTKLEGLTKAGTETSDKLVSLCDTSLQESDKLLKEINFYTSDISTDSWKNMQKNIESTQSKYNTLTSEPTKGINVVTKNLDGFCEDIEKSIKGDEFEAQEQPGAISCIKNFNEYLLNAAEKYSFLLTDHQMKVESFKSEETALMGNLEDTSKELTNTLTSGISGYIHSVESDLSKLLKENFPENPDESDNEDKITPSQQDITFNLSEDITDNSWKKECFVCHNKCDENGPQPVAANFSSLIHIPEENKQDCSMSLNIQTGNRNTAPWRTRSPIGRPHMKSLNPDRKFLPISRDDEWCRQLFDASSSEDECLPIDKLKTNI